MPPDGASSVKRIVIFGKAERTILEEGGSGEAKTKNEQSQKLSLAPDTALNWYPFYVHRKSLTILKTVGVAMALEKELKTYETNAKKWTDQAGKYVLIHGEDVVDFFAAYEDAIKAGYQKFGLDQFLVKQVNTTSAVQYITRHVLPHSSVR